MGEFWKQRSGWKESDWRWERFFGKGGRNGTRMYYEDRAIGKHWLAHLLLCGRRDDIGPDSFHYRVYVGGRIWLHVGGFGVYQRFFPDAEQEAACPEGASGNDFRGNLEHPCYTEDTDEIGIVTNSLGRMTERLNDTINQVYKIEIEKRRRS